MSDTPTMVMSLPARVTAPLPKGMGSSPSGTSPSSSYSARFSSSTTGPVPCIALTRSPLASAGVAGVAT